MRSTTVFWPIILQGIFILLAGCSSEPAKPPSQTPAASPPIARLLPEADLLQIAGKPSTPFEGEGWQPMFDGKTLIGWRETDFTGRGEVQCQAGLIVLNMGDPFTGINWTNDFPKMNYEVAFDATRILGSDFFCGLTVPVSNSFCSLIVGGWGGSLVGISSLDSMDASENETTRFTSFDQNRWYRIRLRVTDTKIEAWIDKDKVVDVVTTDKRISVRPGDIELSKPFGLSCWQTTAALREIKMRRFNPSP